MTPKSPRHAPIDIGFIGLGRMGAAMAEQLDGHDVRLHVHDPDPSCIAPFVDRDATAHASPRAVADAASLVFACLPSPAISLGVAQEVVGGAALSIYVETSTIGQPNAAAIGRILAGAGIGFIDGPVSGGPAGARDGSLSVMAAGEPSVVAAVRPWLARIAGAVFVVGERPGLGQAMKLANNLLAATNLAAGVEALAAATRAGIDPSMALAVFNASSGSNSATAGLLPRYVEDPAFTYGASLSTLLKDVELALADQAPAPVGRAAAAQWRRCVEIVGPEVDILGFVRAQAHLAGATPASPFPYPSPA